MNRLTPEERYLRDAEFQTLVDTLIHAIRNAQYTPTEIREAAMLACIKHEQMKVRLR